MPEYLAPGVYIEETSFRAKSIEGVSTTTTGFIGPTRYGPVHLEPDMLTSLGDFERLYGDGQKLKIKLGLSDTEPLEPHNYLWHAVGAFFNEGGRRLYISRVYRRLDDKEYDPDQLSGSKTGDLYDDGHARLAKGDVTFRARYPGAMGNFRVQMEIRASRNILGSVIEGVNRRPVIGALKENDIVWIRDEQSPPTSPLSANGDLWLAKHDLLSPETDSHRPDYWKFEGAIGSPIASPLTANKKFGDGDIPDVISNQGISIRVVNLSIAIFSPTGEPLGTWRDLPLDPNHKTAGANDSFIRLFAAENNDRTLPIVIELTGAPNGLDIINALYSSAQDQADIVNGSRLLDGISVTYDLIGGNDGIFPAATDYDGKDEESRSFKTGLKQFEDLEDISIVAAPGSTWKYTDERRTVEANTIIASLISHAERMRYRIAVIDSAEKQTIGEVRKVRAKIDSKYAAFYYPWIRLLDPITRVEISLPPSGFVAGIYARNDIERAVYKAPANEVVRGAIGFDIFLNRSQQEVLNPEGINCFRFFEGRGMRLWGARTISSDPEWKYVNLRRYFAYLERSIDKGTQWAVFEPNGERLWANVRSTIEDFLLNEWQNGALLGDKPEKSYFVKCDRSTMSQNDLDNGRLICLIGVAPLRPAEFVIFRIGQWTADRKV